MSRKLLRTETMMGRGDAAEKLRSLADKLDEGRVELSSGNDSVVLEPSDRLEFELEVEEEADGDKSIEIELEWSEKDDGDVEIG